MNSELLGHVGNGKFIPHSDNRVIDIDIVGLELVNGWCIALSIEPPRKIVNLTKDPRWDVAKGRVVLLSTAR